MKQFLKMRIQKWIQKTKHNFCIYLFQKFPFFTGPLKNVNARNTGLLHVVWFWPNVSSILCWEIILDSHWAAVERSSLLQVSAKQACTPACHSSALVPCIRSVQDLAFVDLQQEMMYKIWQFNSGEDSHCIHLVSDTV